MLNRRFYLLFTFAMLPALCGHLYAQSAERGLLYLDDWPYELIDYWVNNGTATPGFVLEQPYRISEVPVGLGDDAGWKARYQYYLRTFYGDSGTGRLILYARGNRSFVSGDDFVRRGLVAAPLREVYLFENQNRFHYNFSGQVNFTFPGISLVNRTVINSELKNDPAFHGDTGEWIYGRINDAYLDIHPGNFNFFFGRTDRNWGALNSPGLILSNNPYSYDHAYFSYTFRKFRFSMLFSRMEDMPGVDSQSVFPDSLLEARRFITAHRFAFSPSSRFQLALSEVTVYGGPNRGFEFGFLNPMNFYYIVQRNNDRQMNGLWALDVFVKPTQRLNLSAQFLIDDVIVNNEPGQNDREKYPDRVGFHLRFSEADYLFSGEQIGVEYTRLSNRTYQSFRTWENFQTRNKSLGYPQASVERIGLFGNYLGLYPFLFKFQASYQRTGDAAISDVFPAEKEPFPVGVVERKWDTAFTLRYLPTVSTEFSAKLGYEQVKNFNHISGRTFTNFTLVLGVHLNLSWNLQI